MSSHKETRQHWMETELRNFAHALALDLALPKTAEDSIYRSMKTVIEIASGLAGCDSAKESAEPEEWIKDAAKTLCADGRIYVRGGLELIGWPHSQKGWVDADELATIIRKHAQKGK